jgi:glycosyltransferase involved in cell wall biosynthesis
MSKYDLSVLIPARNEMFLAKTVETLLENIRGNTEIIVFLDGQWADPGIPDDDRVTIIYSPVSIGQRAATNAACRLSKAKYVMKLDAHCAVSEGFDVQMMADMQDDWTMVPVMRNLHAFDWVCKGTRNYNPATLYTDTGCGFRKYQGPTPKACSECGGKMEKEILWKAKESPKSTAFRFDKTLHFQYWNDFKKRPEGKGDLTETLSIQGSCFMLTRAKYWELKICDEKHGSWGQQGVEVALKTWASGGRVLCNQKTWYAHMFRTQGGDFGFPYPLSGSDVDKARKYSRDTWLEKRRDELDRILNKFYPVPEWHDGEVKKGIVFYTDNQLPLKIAHRVQKQLRSIGLPIVSASLKPMDNMGRNIHVARERGVETYCIQIITALEHSDADIVYFCEHDVLYHPSHFKFTPPTKDKFYYNQNFWRVREDGFAVHWDANQVSGLVCYKELALNWYKKKFDEVQQGKFNRSYEPGGRNTKLTVAWKSIYPNIDIRHKGTMTKSKWSPEDFRDKSTCVNWQEGTIHTIPGWNAEQLLFSQ